MLICWAFYHDIRFEVGTAMEYIAEGLIGKQPGITSHYQSEAAWLGGQIASSLRLQQAEILWRLAQRQAIEAKEPVLVNRACALIARIKEQGDISE